MSSRRATRQPTRSISARRAISADLAWTLGVTWVAMLLALYWRGLPLILTAVPFGCGLGTAVYRLLQIHES